MTVSWTKLKYGFAVALTTLAITGTTIYQVSRNQVKARDCIELMQGTIERCLAAGTNKVALPNYTKTFTSYIYTNIVITNLGYDTTNTVVHTNEVVFTNGSVTTNYLITTNYVVLVGTNFATNTVSFVITNSYSLTNAIGNYVDKDYLEVLDAKIEALAPNYVDTNTVYDGTTNIVMHTFTGLLTSLDIGDHTNFTDYGWYVSQDDLKERYKVLNKLEVTQKDGGMARGILKSAGTDIGDCHGSWTSVVAEISELWDNDYYTYSYSSSLNSWFPAHTYDHNQYRGVLWNCFYIFVTVVNVTNLYSTTVFETGILHNIQFWYEPDTNTISGIDWGVGYMEDIPMDYVADGLPDSTPGWHLLAESGYTTSNSVSWTVDLGYDINILPPECDEVIAGSSHQSPYCVDGSCNSNIWGEARGGPAINASMELYYWQFNYCTTPLP